VPTPKESFRAKVVDLVDQNRWVMDGTYIETLYLRLPRADQIIIINLPRLICLYRVLARLVSYGRGESRPDMADGCTETFNWSFYQYIWNYNKQVLPKIKKALKDYHCEHKAIFLSSQKQIERFKRGLIT
jgi:adenylate kinase family enzyme